MQGMWQQSDVGSTPGRPREKTFLKHSSFGIEMQWNNTRRWNSTHQEWGKKKIKKLKKLVLWFMCLQVCWKGKFKAFQFLSSYAICVNKEQGDAIFLFLLWKEFLFWVPLQSQPKVNIWISYLKSLPTETDCTVYWCKNRYYFLKKTNLLAPHSFP